MYQRIMNRLDVNNASTVPIIIKDRMNELVDILDDTYGSERKPSDMGGYILYFPTQEDVESSLDSVIDFYNLNPEIAEYQDKYSSDDQIWIEELYLLSSEDSLVIIYPKEVRSVG